VFKPDAIAIDTRSPAAVLRNSLAEADVDATMTTAADLAIACGGLLDAAEQGRLSHTGQQLLTESVASASKRDLPSGFCWAKSSTVAPLNAVTLAAWALAAFTPPARPKPPTPLVDRRDDGGQSWMTRPF